MRILVTGGAGFIGSHLCDALIALGHHVVAADNFLLGRRQNVEHLASNPSFRLVEMDVADRDALTALFDASGFDCVFHMAANSDIAASHANPETDFRNTLGTTYSVLEAMRRGGVKSLVFASSSAIYGETRTKIREDHGPLMPISHYGAGKLASEAFMSSYSENYGIQCWMVRFPNVVGDRSTHGVIYDFARKLASTPDRLEVLGDGTQVKPYLHVSDIVSAILFIWQTASGKVNFFNVGGDTRATVKRIAEIVVEESGLDAKIAFTGGDRGWVGDVPKVEYDTSKIQSLGWSPKLDSEGAIRAAARAIFEARA